MKREIVTHVDGNLYGRQDMLPENLLGGFNWRKRVAYQLIRAGSTRIVFLIGGYAIKFPDPTCEWRLFLQGLLANMQERVFGTTKWGKLCPVVFSLPGGWLVVMRRAAPLSAADFAGMDESWLEEPDYRIPAEFKQNSFGWLDGRIVAIDYGN